MLFKKRKIKEKKEIKEERIYFPTEKIKKLYTLLDGANDLHTKTAKYLLWEFIYSTLKLSEPPRKVSDTPRYKLNTDDIMNPYIIKISKEQ